MEDDEKNNICILCQNEIICPVSIKKKYCNKNCKCNIKYCLQCINDAFVLDSRNKYNKKTFDKCPTCRKNFNNDLTIVLKNNNVDYKYKEIEIYDFYLNETKEITCPKCTKWKGFEKDWLGIHRHICDKIFNKCHYCGNSTKFIENHMKNCIMAPIKCKWCNFICIKKNIHLHNNNCINYKMNKFNTLKKNIDFDGIEKTINNFILLGNCCKYNNNNIEYYYNIINKCKQSLLCDDIGINEENLLNISRFVALYNNIKQNYNKFAQSVNDVSTLIQCNICKQEKKNNNETKFYKQKYYDHFNEEESYISEDEDIEDEYTYDSADY